MAGAFLDVQPDPRLTEADLEQIASRLSDLRVPLADIGEYLLLATDNHFNQQIAPNGTSWAPLSPVTLARKKGKRILRENDILQDTIRYQISQDELAVDTDRPYGAVQQFGQPQGASGTTQQGTPIPWVIFPPGRTRAIG